MLQLPKKLMLFSLVLFSTVGLSALESYQTWRGILAAAGLGTGYWLYKRHNSIDQRQAQLTAYDKPIIDTIRNNVTNNVNITHQTINSIEGMMMLNDANQSQKKGLKHIALVYNVSRANNNANNPGHTLVNDLEKIYQTKMNAFSEEKWRPAKTVGKIAGYTLAGIAAMVGGIGLMNAVTKPKPSTENDGIFTLLFAPWLLLGKAILK